jgi:hypothetical protein
MALTIKFGELSVMIAPRQMQGLWHGTLQCRFELGASPGSLL